VFDARLTVEGLREAQSVFGRIQQEAARSQRTRDLSGALALDLAAALDAGKALDAGFRIAEERLFQTEGASGAGKWAPLSPRHKRRKDLLFAGSVRTKKPRGFLASIGGKSVRLRQNRILTLTGRLRESLAKEGPEHIRDVFRLGGRWYVRMGTSVPYALFHHRGGRHLPVRDPIGLGSRDLDEMAARGTKALRPHVLRRVRLLTRTGR
jgi:phage gpG-like protein